MRYELQPKYDSRSSFYGKAQVEQQGDVLTLYSYDTKVAQIDLKKRRAVVYGTYSVTTLRHIKEFLLQNNFPAKDKKQILELYSEDSWS